jgi:hypothetical protein
MEKMEKISYQPREIFVPTPMDIDILQVVADHQGSHISHTVQMLISTHSESSVRSAIRVLLSKRYLDGGKSSSGILLRLTSKGRILLQPALAT